MFDLRERGSPGSDHVLWVATFDGGVRVDLDHGFSCAALELPPSTRAASIYQIQFDRRDRAYLFSAYGVTRLTPDARAPSGYATEHFDLADGLPDLEFTRASAIDTQGRLWAGTIEGVTMYDASAETPDAKPHTLHLLAAREEASGRSLAAGADLGVAQSDVAFELSLLAYQRDHRTRYRSQLKGLDARPGEWIESAHRSYSRLPPADYEFVASARDANGIESEPVAWRFHVHAPWWRSPWAFALYGVGLVAVGLLAGRLRARALARHARELEREVAERTQALAQANRQLEEASLTDPLTGLRNRRYFGLEMPTECERVIRRATRTEVQGDLVFILADIDHFKRINDQYGHAAGDAVLVEFANRIRALLRAGDIAVRWGGEEFLIVLREVERSHAGALAARLLDAVRAAPFHIAEGDIEVTCSAGWAAFPFVPDAPRSNSAEQVVAFADAALYQAKRSGRNRAMGAVTDVSDSGFRLVE